MSLQKNPKKKVVFVLGYATFNLFRDYLKETLEFTMKDLGANYSFININEISKTVEVKDSIVIFICQPEIYASAVNKISKNNNIFILWIFEMFVPLPGEPKKKHKGADRFAICNSLLRKELPIDFIWSYCHKQISFFDTNDMISYMPFGFNDKVFNHTNLKNIENLLFYGSISGGRRRFLMNLAKKGIKVNHLNSSGGITWKARKDEMSKYKYSIDINVGDFYKDYISITRVISLLSAKVLLISHNDLSDIGFINGVDYLQYDDVDSAAKIFNLVKNDKDKIQSIVDSAYEKTKQNFNMANLLTTFFKKHGYSI